LAPRDNRIISNLARFALEGRFDRPTAPITLDPFDVGDFNARVLNSAHREIYAANDKFLLFDGRDFCGMRELLQKLKGLGG
jgi:hypothetical protein